MKTIYVAGPMSGYPEHNFPAFDAAKELLQSQGWTVFSPADIDRTLGYDPHGPDPAPELLAQMFRWDVECVMRADAIYLLRGHLESKGASIERAIAKMLGKDELWQSREEFEAQFDHLNERFTHKGPMAQVAPPAKLGYDAW